MYGTAQFKLTQVCRYTRVLAHLMYAKLQKLVCAPTVAHDFGVRKWESRHTRHTRDALGLPHYMCVV